LHNICCLYYLFFLFQTNFGSKTYQAISSPTISIALSFRANPLHISALSLYRKIIIQWKAAQNIL